MEFSYLKKREAKKSSLGSSSFSSWVIHSISVENILNGTYIPTLFFEKSLRQGGHERLSIGNLKIAQLFREVHHPWGIL